jgi:uncharacterized membrane protein YfcA
MNGIGTVGWIVLGIAAVMGGCAQGSVGFGLSFTVVPVLTVLDPGSIPTVPLLLGLPLLGGTAIRELRSLDLRGSAWLAFGRLPGTAVGAGLLAIISARALGLLVGLVLLLNVAISVGGRQPPLTNGTRLAGGFASGLLSTTAGIGGPPITLLYRKEPGARMRATTAVAIFLGVIMSIAAVVLTGRWDSAQVVMAAALLPAALLGLWGSVVVNRRIQHSHLQVMVLALGAIAGIGAIAQALLL